MTVVEKKGKCFLLALMLILALSFFGCSGDSGAPGPAGPAGSSEGTITGTVTNSLTGTPIAGATVTTDPVVQGVNIATGANGSYSADLPIGTYSVTGASNNFTSQTATATLVAEQTVTKNFPLVPTSPVIVSVSGLPASVNPADTFNLAATVDVMDGSAITGYQWSQTASALATITNGTTATATVTLGDAADYKAELFANLENLDRFMVQGISPFALEEAGLVTFQVAVTTSSGTYNATIDVHANLDFATVNPGIQNVPIGLPVLLHGKDQASFNWTITGGPTGSTATLDDGTVRNPSFTPDKVGTYTLTESVSGQTLDVIAGTWTGAITGQDGNGRPNAALCTVCHDDTIAPDQFTGWKESGHAEIFSDNLNTSTHYGESCFACHTVGFNKSADNTGIDEASDYADFLAAGLLNKPSANNWTTVLASYPATAKQANIQCESCHGPQNDGQAHPGTPSGASRINITSDVCGSCHGEPTRHARFQQWEESKHGDYALAVSRGTDSSCARCHAGQGFLAWLPQLQAGDPGNITTTITWTADTVHPQTCAVCHDPHEQGTTSGEPNTATVRLEGNTPLLPAGFQANGVGRGAICITCHNTRNGTHNDGVAGAIGDTAPHTAAQGDVLMGQNAYFVNVDQRSPHSLVTDTCATCHMELTPPPAELSDNLAGTNHSFEASLSICTQCHGTFNGGTIQETIETELEELKAAIESAIRDEIIAQTGAGNTVTITGEVGGVATSTDITDGNTVSTVELTEYHGRMAMNITVSGTIYEYVRLASDTVVNGGTLLSSTQGQDIAKATWNYFLIEGDGSEGIHNPGFTLEVLSASSAAL